MNTYVHLWSYLDELFLEWETFQTKFVGKIKTKFCLQYLFRKSYRLWDNVTRSGGARQATDDSIIRRRQDAFAWRVIKAHTHTQNIQGAFLFHCNNRFKNATHCYVVRTLHVLFPAADSFVKIEDRIGRVHTVKAYGGVQF